MPHIDFISVLGELKNGRAHIDCSRKITDLTAAVCETNKKGKLLLEIVIEPTGKDVDTGRITETSISWACRIAKPEHDTGRSIFFVTKDGDLTRNDPNQMELYEEQLREQARVDGKDTSAGKQ